MRVYLSLLLAVVLGGFSVAVAPRPAEAHPSGTYTVNTHATLGLFHSNVQLRYIVDYSEIPSLQWSIVNDTDGDGVISEAEVLFYVERAKFVVAANLLLTVDGRPLVLEPGAAVASFRIGDLGVETLRMELNYSAVAEAEGLAAFEFEDRNFENITGWRAIIVAPSAGTSTDVTPDWLLDPSAGLTIVPDQWLTFPPKQKWVGFGWDPATGVKSAATDVSVSPTRVITPQETGSRVANLIRGDLALGSVMFALAFAFVLGLLDGLGPGHGKTVVGSYVAGRDARYADVLAIGVMAALTHAVVAIAVGLLAIELSSHFLPDLVQWLGVGAGIVALTVGSWLLWRRLRAMRVPLSVQGSGHRHATAGRSNVIIGLIGGVIPCPTAFILLLTAVSVGRVGYGIGLAAAFSAGTALALVVVGLGTVIARRTAERASGSVLGSGRVMRFLPVASAVVMIFAGGLITQQAISGNVL